MSDQFTEFENPVPEADWDAAAKRKFRWAAALIGTVSLLAVARIGWTVFEVTHRVHTVTEIAGFTHRATPVATDDTHLVADGVSGLPGDYASVSYKPLAGQFEYWERADEYGPYGGSRWGLATADEGRMNQVDLSHFLLAPMADPIAEETQRLKQEHPNDVVSGPKTIKVHGRSGVTWKEVASNGDVNYTTWFFGDVHSFRLECGYKVDSVDFAKQCRRILRSVRFER